MKFFKNVKKKALVAMMTFALAIVSCVPVFAESPAGLSTVETALTNSFTQIGASMTSLVSSILPIILPIVGAIVLIYFGIKHFKSISKKA